MGQGRPLAWARMADGSGCEADEGDAKEAVAELLGQLKAAHPKSWMVVTNARGELAEKSLLKLFAKEKLAPAEGTAACLRGLLHHLDEKRAETPAAPPPPTERPGRALDEAWLRREFEELRGGGGGEAGLPFGAWMSWGWLKDRVGPPGSSAAVTPAAALELWERVVPCGGPGGGQAASGGLAGLPEFLELAGTLQSECLRATAIQSALRGRVARRQAEKAQESSEAGKVEGAAKLAPFNPTPDCAIAQALNALEVGEGDVLYDLGCGDGRLLLAAARRGARCVGVEYDVRFADRARQAASDAGLSDVVTVVHGDACGVDLAPATKVFVYLVPSGLQLMAPALSAALDRGARVASYTFSLSGETAVEVLTAETRAPECKVSVYRRG